MYEKSTLTNGIRLVTHRMKQRHSVALGFWVGVGGRHENERNKGVAHFIEHILFKGSANYSCEQIKEQIEGVGGALNAFTSEEQTCYYAKIPRQHFAKTFDVLADMVFFPKITPRDVKKEGGVILEEIKMYHDLPQYQVMELLEGLMWPQHPLGMGLAGTPETVGGLTGKDLRRFFQENYNPSNIVIAACGDFEHDVLLRAAKRKLGGVASGPASTYVPADTRQDQPRLKFYRKATEQMHVALGTLAYHEDHPDRYAASLLNVILGGNMSSRLFVEVREKRGLAYSIHSSMKCLHDTGQFLVRAGVDNGKVVKALELVIKELSRVALGGVSASEFRRARDYLLGQFQIGLEDTMDHMLWIGEDMVALNRTKSLAEVVKAFEQVTPADVKKVARDLFQARLFNLAVVGPLSEAQEGQMRQLLV